MPCKHSPKTDLIRRQEMRPLRHGGSHFVNAFWHGDQDDSDVTSCYAVTTRWPSTKWLPPWRKGRISCLWIVNRNLDRWFEFLQKNVYPKHQKISWKIRRNTSLSWFPSTECHICVATLRENDRIGALYTFVQLATSLTQSAQCSPSHQLLFKYVKVITKYYSHIAWGPQDYVSCLTSC